MTPKEKAKELVDKFYQLFPLDRHVTVTEGDLSWEYNSWQQSKQCALIAVDEVLEELDHLPFDDQYFGTSKMKYWQEVKQEIEKL